MRILKRFLGWGIFFGVIFGIWFLWPWRAIRHPAGVLVPGDPVQKPIEPKPLGAKDGFVLTGIAEFELRARVLSGFRYHSGEQAGLVPVDIAVGWGPMSDQAVIDKLKISQTNRFFFYQWWNEPPLPEREIMTHATNLHIISATRAIAWKVGFLRRGDIARMKGWLVNAESGKGWTWKSSTSREDTGNGACELFYVESLEVEK